MTFEPLVVISFISAILGILGLVLRAFVNGTLLSDKVVLRSDYERLVQINETYAEKFGQQTDAIRGLVEEVERLHSAKTAKQ